MIFFCNTLFKILGPSLLTHVWLCGPPTFFCVCARVYCKVRLYLSRVCLGVWFGDHYCLNVSFVKEVNAKVALVNMLTTRELGEEDNQYYWCATLALSHHHPNNLNTFLSQ